MTFTESIAFNSSMARQPERATPLTQRIMMLQAACTTSGMVASQRISQTPKSAVFSVDQGKIIDKFSIPGNNVESMGIDHIHDRLYVNIRDKQRIGVVDLLSKKVIATWTAPGLQKNTALAVDEKNERIFVAGRNPGIFYVFDNNGKVVRQAPCANINDDMTWDPVLKRVYVSGTQGLSIFHQDSPDNYTNIADIPTNGGKTSFYVPQLNQFYVVHPKTEVDIAGLLVYRVNP
jgi:hypothetical protein